MDPERRFHVFLEMGEDERSWEKVPDSKISSSTFHPMPAGGKTSKKRAAPLQIGPKPKKIHSEKQSFKDEKPSVVKRSRPVTLLQTHDSGSSSDEEVKNFSDEEDAELADEDEEMLDVPTKDPNGGCQVSVSGLNMKLIDRSVQLQEKRTRHRKLSLTNARLQNLMLHCSEMLNAYGVLPGRKGLARSGRNTFPIS